MSRVNGPLDLPLARSEVDRDYLARSRPKLFDELWSDPLTKVLVLHGDQTLVRAAAVAGAEGSARSHSESDSDRAAHALALLSAAEVPAAKLRAYLGKTLAATPSEPSGSPIVLAVLGDNAAAELALEGREWARLRATGAGLSARDAGLFAQALALANWHESHGYCVRCGKPTMITQGGWVRVCLEDETESYPRTDPAIIVSVVDESERILLGSQASWEPNRWSVLAGFVEPGESLQAAVIREVFEESGVRVSNPQFLGSQSWPFPYSLMVAFTATASAAAAAELKPDGIEIVRLRWFSRDELLAEAPRLLLPGRVSISRALIEHWLGSVVESGTELS